MPNYTPMKIPFVSLVTLTLLLPSLLCCKRNPYQVRTASIEAEINVKRLESDLFNSDPAEIPAGIDDLKSRYGDFLQLFSLVINTGNVNDTSFTGQLTAFCTDRQNNEVFNLTMKVYPDFTTWESDLEEAFRHYLYYFPTKTIPDVYTCITGFNNSIITGQNILGISLDRYLGADCIYYPQLQIYKYVAARMTPEYIVPDCMYGWGTSEWDFNEMGYQADNVLSRMLHEGKLRYFMKCMLPGTSDEVIFGFTPAQMTFCRNNEGQMWQYLIENDLLFKTDQFIIRKLTGEAPFTSYFTNESPGRAAIWTGFRIIESYMRKNPNVKLDDIMKDTNVQEILEGARYNPQQ